MRITRGRRCGAQVVQIFQDFEALDYARAGSSATEDFELVEGPLSGPLGLLPHTIEPMLRKYGLPTKLNKASSTLSMCSWMSNFWPAPCRSSCLAQQSSGNPSWLCNHYTLAVAGRGGAGVGLHSVQGWRPSHVQSGRHPAGV